MAELKFVSLSVRPGCWVVHSCLAWTFPVRHTRDRALGRTYARAQCRSLLLSWYRYNQEDLCVANS